MSVDQMDKESLEPHAVEEIYEESSTMLVGRLAFLFSFDPKLLCSSCNVVL